VRRQNRTCKCALPLPMPSREPTPGSPTKARESQKILVALASAVQGAGGHGGDKAAVLRTAQDTYALDSAFALIEGHPAVCPEP